MSEAAVMNWSEANQRYLMARLAFVRDALARHAGRTQEASDPAEPAIQLEQKLHEAIQAMPAPPALDTLAAAFRLSPFERDVLLLCAGMELDSSFPTLCALAQGQAQRAWPTFSLALAALADPHWSALTPAAPLRHWRLIEVGGGESLTCSPLRIDEPILHYLTGISYPDERLQALVETQTSPKDLPPSQRLLAHQIAAIWSQPGGASILIHLAGDDTAGKRAVAAFASSISGMQLRIIRAADVPVSAAEREALSRLCEREAVLNRTALLVISDEPEKERAAHAFLERTRCPLLAACRESLRLGHRQTARIDVARPDAAEQRQLWQQALGPLGSQLNGKLEAVVSHFELGCDEIQNACVIALSALKDPNNSQEGGLDREFEMRLWNACRLNARARLDDLAQRIEPLADWNDLVLPEPQRQTLREIVDQVRFRRRVYDEWAFASKGARGLGITALFAGSSGTGKTMAAEVLARELRLDLYRIDLSQVVSKYIGETEKNLRRVFDAAEAGGAVLLFDEADALFGKRSEVKDSHDRYANIEISYLLQRMESYRGLAILTTNMKTVLDVSFLRRLRFIVQFPFPDAALRAEIWRRVFPAETPRDRLDINKLARLNVAGGNIRNIAVHAAFLAASSNEPVRMHHLLQAARGEYAKMEKQLAETEIRDWI
jgi:hypothetical protein